MTRSWLSATTRTGGSAHGNHLACLAAEAARVEFDGGQFCPEECGSVIACQVGLPPLDSVARHVANPAACRAHPDFNNARKARGE